MHPDNALPESNISAAAQMQKLHQAHDDHAAAIAPSAAVLAQPDEPLPAETVSFKQSAPRKAPSLDLDSISMFPSLGSASPARPAATSTWGAGPSSRVKSNLGAVGDQRRSPAAAAAAAASVGSSAGRVSTSGNIQERMQIPSVQVPGFGKTTVGDIVKTVMVSSGARIESTTSQATGLTTFLISGKPEAVAKARRDLRSSFAKKVKPGDFLSWKRKCDCSLRRGVCVSGWVMDNKKGVLAAFKGCRYHWRVRPKTIQSQQQQQHSQ